MAQDATVKVNVAAANKKIEALRQRLARQEETHRRQRAADRQEFTKRFARLEEALKPFTARKRKLLALFDY